MRDTTTPELTSRRTVLKAAGSAAGLAMVAGKVLGAEPKPALKRRRRRPSIRFQNKAFYDAGGKFDEEQAKDAILTLCAYHRYPVFPALREGLWVSDYGAGEFTQCGLAAHLFVNNEQDRYMMFDVFLLPGQMLPEHWHVEGGGNPVKCEGWLVRWGLSHIVGIGEPNLGPDVAVPKCHNGGKVTTEHEVVAKPGMFVPLAKVLTRHWQLAGPEGAIITEVANVHTNEAVRHTDPAMNRFFLEG